MKRLSYIIRALVLMWKHRDEKQNRQKMRRFEREVKYE